MDIIVSQNVIQCVFDFDALNNLLIDQPTSQVFEKVPQKLCTKCKEVKSLNDFDPDKVNGSGYHSWCKKCRRSNKKDWSNLPKIEVSFKCCLRCNKVKEIDQFGKDRSTRDGYNQWCKLCCSEYYKASKTPDLSKKQRAQRLRKNFGLTSEQYDSMLEQQGGVCACCNMPETHISARSHKVQPLSVDHDHETGEVRALLCHSCNAAYGFLQEDENRILALLAYHKQHQNS